MSVLLYYLSQMQRVFSILLILVFSFGPLSATLGASEDTRLPACCRRHGAHRCAMSAGTAARMAEAASGKIIVTAPSTCPAFPGSTDATVPAPQALAAAPVGLPVLHAQTRPPAADHVAPRLRPVRTGAGRGPPAASLA